METCPTCGESGGNRKLFCSDPFHGSPPALRVRCGSLCCDAISHEVGALDDGSLELTQTGPESWAVYHRH